MLKGLVTILMLGFYGYVLFQNGLELNGITIVFSVLYFICWILVLLLISLRIKGESNKSMTIALICVWLMIAVISYEAITELPESDHAFQKELAVILGNSPQFAELGQLSNHNIESVTFHGDPKYGSFDQILGYVVEVQLTNNDQAYYFMCQGSGPYCSQFELVDEKFAQEMILSF